MNKLIVLQNTIDKYVNNYIKKINKIYDKKIKISNVNQYLLKKSRLDNFYIDSNMINFLYSIIDLSEYNPIEFYKLCIGVNNILRLRNEIEEFYSQNSDYPQNIAEMLESAIELKSNTVNNIHNFIYSVPKTNVMYNYVNNIVDRFNILISRNVDTIHKYYKQYNKLHGYNSSTKIVNYNNTKGYDYFNDNSPIVNKNYKIKIIDFYN